MRRKVGIYNLHMRAMGGGEKLTLVMAEHLSLRHNVFLFCAEPLDIPSLEQFFAVDLSRITVVPLRGPGPFARVVARVHGKPDPSHHYLQLRKFDLDLFINNSYGSELVCPAPRGIFMCMFPHAVTVSNVLDSYSTIVAISKYSADWVRKRWDRDSEVIYPPCDDMGPPADKAKIILHVGRFIAGSDEDERHHKGQGLLLETFKRMTDLHSEGWELHFAGSAGSDKQSRAFVDQLKRHAHGLPVVFHFNSSWNELRELYRKAAIYWHATGYGLDAHTHPFRQEHFGISTVEGMSARAVPVVCASGGQREIVADQVDGCWWEDIDQLVSHTQRLANDPALRCKLGEQAVLSSKRFNRDAFAAAVDQLISDEIRKPPNAQALT